MPKLRLEQPVQRGARRFLSAEAARDLRCIGASETSEASETNVRQVDPPLSGRAGTGAQAHVSVSLCLGLCLSAIP
jgi:hypothetical protein